MIFFKDRQEETRAVFPATYGLGDATVTLHADGRIEGDDYAFRKAVEKATVSSPIMDMSAAIFWLLSVELSRQSEERRKGMEPDAALARNG